MTKSQRKLYLELKLLGYNNNRDKLWDDSLINGDYWIIKALLEDGLDIHEYDVWGLKCACENKHYNIAKLLIKYGANVNRTLEWAKIDPQNYNIIIFLKKCQKKK